MTPVLDVRGASIPARLRSTALRLDAGELVAVIGPNGGGKTSLLRGCSGIDGSAESITVAGEDLRAASPARRSHLLGYLPASRDAVWPISVRDVVALGLAVPDARRVDALISSLELESLAGRAVDRLSTGERARVLLARVLAPNPMVLLLDEPLSNLDPYWVLRLLGLLRGIADGGVAVAVALHDIERMTAFDRALLVDGGEIRADLSPSAMLAGREFARAFRIERAAAGWRLSSPAGRRSSP
ncbi:ABC transporter ATP-binding protein [Sphingomonas sp.]|uniref:ABC transporter ATP-binding protein n=1 Tax=Sphingomonas sp. TaxID=28214 RepID=UPI0025DDC757|nr:ABC transporter ATP-binding protein [Sphingomonas sp.]MBV9527108.1 ABC transporter ATP-binding protein [Sphingomonas sp.]